MVQFSFAVECLLAGSGGGRVVNYTSLTAGVFGSTASRDTVVFERGGRAFVGGVLSALVPSGKKCLIV